MSKACKITGKRPMYGNNVSHAHNKTRRRFDLNLHTHRYYLPTLKKWIKVKLSAKAMRIIDKLGIETFVDSKGRFLPPNK